MSRTSLKWTCQRGEPERQAGDQRHLERDHERQRSVVPAAHADSPERAPTTSAAERRSAARAGSAPGWRAPDHRQQRGREDRLAEEARVARERHRALEQRARSPDPGEEAGDQEQGVGAGDVAAGARARRLPKTKRVDRQQEQRVDQRPEETEHGAAVARLELAPYQREEEATMAVDRGQGGRHVERILGAFRSTAPAKGRHGSGSEHSAKGRL